MKTLKKVLVVFTVVFSISGISNIAVAHCGKCGIEGSAAHDHSKETCIKCNHEKACAVEDCQHAAHKAECICPKEQEEK